MKHPNVDKLATKILNSACSAADAIATAAYWPLLIAFAFGALGAYAGLTPAQVLSGANVSAVLLALAITLIGLGNNLVATVFVIWTAAAAGIVLTGLASSEAVYGLTILVIALITYFPPTRGWNLYARKEDPLQAHDAANHPNTHAAASHAPARTAHIAGLDLDDMPQPYAGAIVMFETIAEFGMESHYANGQPTENRDLCLRLARELRDAGARVGNERATGICAGDKGNRDNRIVELEAENQRLRAEVGRSDAAVAAIEFSQQTDSAWNFLKCWLHGDWEKIRAEWPECPEDVFVERPSSSQSLAAAHTAISPQHGQPEGTQ
jgi:hypothetical protein